MNDSADDLLEEIVSGGATGAAEVEGTLVEYTRSAVESLVASGRVDVQDYQAEPCSIDNPEAWLVLSDSYLATVGLKFCSTCGQYVLRDGSDCFHE